MLLFCPNYGGILVDTLCGDSVTVIADVAVVAVLIGFVVP